jgi:lipopolysaccharide export system permease protein
MKTLQRYILLELAGPFVISLSLLTFILFMRHMVFLFPKIAGKNLESAVIIEVIMLSLPFIIALVLPMAVLVAVIMSFGRFSADNEVTALKALGVPAHRLMASPMAAAFCLMLISIWFNDQVLPESNHRYKTLLMDIAYLKPTVKLREGVIMDDFGGMGILVHRIKEAEGLRNLTPTAPEDPWYEKGETLEGPAELFGIIITENLSSGTRRTIVADSGFIRPAANRKDAVLTLYHGEIQEVDPQRQEQFQRLFFTRHRIRLADISGMLERGRSSRYRSDRELSMKMIRERVKNQRAEIDSLYRQAEVLMDSLRSNDSTTLACKKFIGEQTAADFGKFDKVPAELSVLPRGGVTRFLEDPKTRLIAICREANFIQKRTAALQVEFWKKISIPFASLVFVLLGVPLGIISRRGGAGVSISISMGVFLVYWICLISGETLADRLLLSPFWAMWTPNALFLILGLWLLLVQVRGRRSLALARSGFRLDFRKLWRRLRESGKDTLSRQDK